MIVAECFLAKNIMVTVAGQTPYRALYGRDPPALSEFEPTSETQLDDQSAVAPGHSRDFLRVRGVAIQAMVQQTAQMRLERALASKTRLSTEQHDIQPGDLVDFWRKPATKVESGWRGPATVTVAPGPCYHTLARLELRREDTRLAEVTRLLVLLHSFDERLWRA